MKSIYDREHEVDTNSNDGYSAHIKEYTELVDRMVEALEKKILNHKEFRYFLEELPSEGKRIICNTFLKSVPINKAMKYTNSKIMTLMFSKINTHKKEVFIIIYSLLQEIYINHYIDDNSAILKNEDIIRKRYGDWHYYFALLLVPNKLISDKKVDNAIAARLETLKEEIYEKMAAVDNNDKIEEITDDSMSKKENELLQKERKLRIELQEKNDKAEVLIKQLQEQLNSKENELKEAFVQIEWLENKLEQSEKQKNESDLAYKEIVKELNLSNKEIQKIKREFNILINNKPVERQVVVHSSTVGLTEAFKQFYEAVKNEVVLKMKNIVEDSITLESMDNRLSIQAIFDFLTVLESFKKEYINNSLNVVTEEVITEGIQVQGALIDEDINLDYDVDYNVKHTDLLGKFTRYVHGGRIEFEDGQYTNVSESVVNAVGMKHGALVECKAKKEGGYLFNLVLQGDDEGSNVLQFWGYVKMNNDGSVSCVDINTMNEYMIHVRDLDYWEINDGDTGLFNINENFGKGNANKEHHSLARISRITKEQITENIEPLGTKSVRKVKDIAKENVEKFLKGCTIVIMGGLEKWFSDTVALTGAKLIHNTGEQPHRVYNDIKKANALFLLLTANSHQATWGSVEMAKMYNIPLFKIQGSRSNLLSLLWENREIIKQSVN